MTAHVRTLLMAAALVVGGIVGFRISQPTIVVRIPKDLQIHGTVTVNMPTDLDIRVHGIPTSIPAIPDHLAITVTP